MSTAAEASPPPPISIAKLGVPKTTSLVYETIFKGQVDEATLIQLRKISDFRNEVVVASERLFAAAAINGVQKYLPSLFGLMDATEKLPPDFTKYLQITWTSSLAGKSARANSHSNWSYEVVNVLMTYGMLHRRQASQRLESVTDEDFNVAYVEITKLLAQAAGIFQYASDHVSSRFFVNPKDLPVPEIFAETFSMLASLCVAEQQELVVKRAVQKQSSLTTVAKLCAAATVQYDTCLRMFRAVQQQSVGKYKILAGSLEDYIVLKKAVYDAQMFKYLGLGEKNDGHMGVALAFLQYADKLLSELNGVTRLADENTDAYWPVVMAEQSVVARLYRELDKDNNDIFHELIKPEAVVPVEPKLLAKVQPFTPPPSATLNIVRKENSFLCVIQ